MAKERHDMRELRDKVARHLDGKLCNLVSHCQLQRPRNERGRPLRRLASREPAHRDRAFNDGPIRVDGATRWMCRATDQYLNLPVGALFL